MRIVPLVLLGLLLTGCSDDYKQDPVKLCDGVVVAKDSMDESVNVAYTYNKTYYVSTYSLWHDNTLFANLQDGEKVKVYAWDDNVEAIQK